MKSIIFIAPPAGGKGTVSDYICSKYNLPHISTGDLLRSASNSGDERGKEIQEKMKSGALIDDETIFALIKERISKKDCSFGYILDGFPRNLEQARVYDNILSDLGKDLGNVILLDVPKDLAEKRIVGRISCPKCGRVYNSVFDEMKPKVENMCDDCHIELVKRADDNAATYEVRYQTYIDKTQPLIEYYRDKNVLSTVDATKSMDEVIKDVEKIIRGE